MNPFTILQAYLSILFTSSIQANLENDYGQSKLTSENFIRSYTARTNSPSYIYRLPNIFGKFCKPNYNSVVATFCYNIARELPISIHNPNTSLSLVYIDDLIKSFVGVMRGAEPSRDPSDFVLVNPIYYSTVGYLAQLIKDFHSSRSSLLTFPVGEDFLRALYSTYISYLSLLLFHTYRCILMHEVFLSKC